MEPTPSQLKTATDSDVELAKKVVDEVFYPNLKRNIDTLNSLLEKHNIRAGIDIHWYFDRIDKSKK